MDLKKYEVLDEYNHVLATGMDLRIALVFMKAYCEEYYMESVTLTLKELDRTGENVSDTGK